MRVQFRPPAPRRRSRASQHVVLAVDIAGPAERQGRLDRQPRRGAEHRGAPRRILPVEQLPAGHGDHRRRHALGLQPRRARPSRSALPSRWPAGSTARAPLGLGQHIGAARRQVLRQRRCAAPAGSAATARAATAPCGSASAAAQHSAVSTASAGRNTSRFGMARSEARCSTGWWVGPSSPRPMTVMGHDIDDPHAHQRRQPDRAARVVGENQERAAIGDQAAVQREAVHRRRHAVLADAPVDVAAGEVAGRRPSSCRGVTVRLEWVRSAEPPISSGIAADQHLQRLLAGLARGDDGLVSTSFGLKPPSPKPPASGHSPRRRRGRTPPAPRRRAARRFSQASRARPPARAGRMPGAADLVGDHEGRVRPAQPVARAEDFGLAQRRAVRALACPPWSARRSRWWCGRRSATAAHRPAPPSSAAPPRRRHGRRGLHVPAIGLEARRHVVGGRQAGRPVDRDVVVVPQHDQPRRARDGRRARPPHGRFPPSGSRRRRSRRCSGRPARRRAAPPACARRAPCRRRWRCPGRAGRWWSRCPARGRIRDGRRSWRRAGGTASARPCPCRRKPVRCSSA